MRYQTKGGRRPVIGEPLENRWLFNAYMPRSMYGFSSSVGVDSIFPNTDASVTFVDAAGINTESAGADPVLKAGFSNSAPGDVDAPDGHQFEDANGDIFGAADVGGSATQPSGAIWEWQSGSSSLMVLASFDADTVGAEPRADYMDSSGNIYGTTQIAGDGSSTGSIWEYHASDQQITFVPIPFSPGSISGAVTADSIGDIFGTTSGTAASPGIVFEVPAQGTIINTLATFSSDQTGNIGDLAIDGSDNIFGTTSSGSTGAEFYEVPAANRSVITPLASVPESGGLILLDPAGDLFTYGLEASGSAFTENLYELPANQQATNTIATLDDDTEGDDTSAFALDNSTGTICGANQDGGANDSGALFTLTPGGGGPAANSSNLTASVSHSTLPASVVAGGKSHGQATVIIGNSGSTPDNGKFKITLFASSDGTIDVNSIVIGNATAKLKLKAAMSAPAVVSIRSLPATLNGNYTLLAQVADASGNVAASATGPALTATAPFIAFSSTLVGTTLAPSNVVGQKTKAVVQLMITNNGNIVSSGKSSIALYGSVDASASDGLLLHSASESIVLKPGASRVVTVPVQSIPAVPPGSYNLVAQVIDPKGGISSVSTSSIYSVAAPFVALVPTAANVVMSKDGTATLNFTVVNNGNIAPTGFSTIAVLPSMDSTPANTLRAKIPALPGKPNALHLKLTAAQVALLQSAEGPILQVSDPLGDVQSLSLQF